MLERVSLRLKPRYGSAGSGGFPPPALRARLRSLLLPMPCGSHRPPSARRCPSSSKGEVSLGPARATPRASKQQPQRGTGRERRSDALSPSLRAGHVTFRLVLLQACLNGARGVDEHPALPVTGAELAADASACVRAGAGAIHCHPRDADGQESLHVDVIDAVVREVRAACGVPVGRYYGRMGRT